jgi:hypothetical protein
MDYRWLNNGNPDESESFKWNFMRDMVKPQMDIQGPGVGSLLYALNPETSELGLKQMDNELNLQLKANEDFDKRGQNALKFMEDRVQEDIKRKQLNNVDAGHANSMISNYITALQGGNPAAIGMAEQQIRQTIPNADYVIQNAQSLAQQKEVQNLEYAKYDALLPRGDGWANKTQRDKFNESLNNANLDAKQKEELHKQANMIPDQSAVARQAIRTAINTYHAQNAAGNAANTDYDNWLVEAKKKYPGQNETFYKGLYDRVRNRGK